MQHDIAVNRKLLYDSPERLCLECWIWQPFILMLLIRYTWFLIIFYWLWSQYSGFIISSVQSNLKVFFFQNSKSIPVSRWRFWTSSKRIRMRALTDLCSCGHWAKIHLKKFRSTEIFLIKFYCFNTLAACKLTIAGSVDCSKSHRNLTSLYKLEGIISKNVQLQRSVRVCLKSVLRPK